MSFTALKPDHIGGDWLITADGTPMLVKSIEAEGYTATTYNLTVANAHTFFVGEERIWVHNQNGDCGDGNVGGNGNVVENPPDLEISRKQLGQKSRQHMRDFDLDVSSPADRQRFTEIINEIASSPDQVLRGTMSGGGPNGRRDVLFYIKDSDVVVTDLDGNFVTILKDGALTNPNVLGVL